MKTIKRGDAAFYPMTIRLDCSATLRVSDDAGRLVRSEELRPGTHLVERLRNAHETYQRLGWTVSGLRPGAWGVTAERAERRLLIAVRAGLLVTAAATSTAATAH